jgi:hypothetical protein
MSFGTMKDQEYGGGFSKRMWVSSHARLGYKSGTNTQMGSVKYASAV